MEIGNVTVLDGTAQIEDAVIIDAATASRAIDDGELEEVVDAALRALILTNKSLVYVKQPDERKPE